eukprot:TRINITY_DN4615_c0_g1_i1.p1 TRINITY_DN4615_c0_g1~~TRINITY_DN4615_c0_g1_i1.p1  ORF type:complete len:165 (+),score=41.18 TRINITY_DN4615_c0_g1_i1:27-497(+)
MTDPIAESEQLKEVANRLFADKKFAQAYEKYTSAIERNPNNPILYSNRAFADLKLENYGLAIEDATKAIALDPKYIKAYYRRGATNMLLGKHQLALKDFKQVVQIHPNDKDARLKLTECQKAIHRAAFEAAIASENTKLPSEVVDLASISTFCLDL